MTSPDLTGGKGYSFEDAVVAHYLVGLLCGVSAIALGPRIVTQVAQQQRPNKEPLDDVIVDAIDVEDHSGMRLSIQVKTSLTISAASSNEDFRRVISECWRTLQKPGFREGIDRVGFAVQKTAIDTISDLTTVCEWARSSSGSSEKFFQRFADGGESSSATKRKIVTDIREILHATEKESVTDDGLFRLFEHMVCIKIDALHEGSTLDASAIVALQQALTGDQVGSAEEVWNRLRLCAADGRTRAAIHSKASLLRLLPKCRLKGAPAYAEDMRRLQEHARVWLAGINGWVGGVHIPRGCLEDGIKTSMENHRLTLITGSPGCGKTVLLARVLGWPSQEERVTLLLAANRLAGQSWAQYAKSIGLATTSIEHLLVEVSATSYPTLFIDGLDRIEQKNRPIVIDLIGQILTNKALSSWKIVATARDTGVETLRSWIPPDLFKSSEVEFVKVRPSFFDDQAKLLAFQLPALKPLLFSMNNEVQALARRPFFAEILARGLAQSDCSMVSEIDLINAWWGKGGYDAQGEDVISRQQALLDLAEGGADRMGRNVRVRNLPPQVRKALQGLEEDGVVRLVGDNHMAQFSHDIFFEWAFFHRLLSFGDSWIEGLPKEWESPELARMVELLAQYTYAKDPQQWKREIRMLEQPEVHPLLLLLWMIAPVQSLRFYAHADTYTDVLVENNCNLLYTLLRWMRAEKATHDQGVASEGGDHRDVSAPGWFLASSDVGDKYERLFCWAVMHIDLLSDESHSALIDLFEVSLRRPGLKTAAVGRIVSLCKKRLRIIEASSGEPPNSPLSSLRRAPCREEAWLRSVLRAVCAHPRRMASKGA